MQFVHRMGRGHDLLEAARKGDAALASKILQHISKRIGTLATFRRSPSINTQDINGYTPLHHACLNGHFNIVCMLLAHEAALDVPDIRGSTPLYLAAWAGHHDIVKTLLMHPARPANPNVQTLDNETPLHCAAQHGHNVVVAILLAYGADPTLRNDSFQTSLDLAAQFGRLQVVQLLLRTHPELIAPYAHRQPPTVDATAPEVISDDLKRHLATSSNRHIFTHSCLHLASRNGHKKVVETLLAAGVNVNVLTPSGTALHEAALCGKKSVVKVLLKAGIDVYEQDGNGRTALDLLGDYPPHVTYEIVSIITDHIRSRGRDQVARDSAVSGEDRINTTLPRLPPKEGKLRNIRNVELPKNNFPKGLTNSLNALPQSAEPYLLMRPIRPRQGAERTKSDDSSLENGIDYTPLFQQPYLNLQANRKQVGPTAKQSDFISSDFSREDKGAIGGRKQTAQARYRCVDDYVVMSSQKASSNQSSMEANGPKTPIPSPRSTEYGDYANIQPRNKHAEEPPYEVNNNNTNSNCAKDHSPTPDFPPPPAAVAEHTILQFIQPPNTGAARLSSIFENFGQIGSPDSLSSHTSDTLEQFVGEDPFAGLFKGSTLNLSNPDTGLLEQQCRLRSPDLVRAIKPIPAKRNPTVTPTDSVANSARTQPTQLEAEVDVWGEIETILESIDHEVADCLDEQADYRNRSLPNTKELQKMLKIRNPSDLVMGITSHTGTKWCHSAYTLLYGQVSYGVYYLGSTVIKQLRGTISARKSIQKLKFNETQLNVELDEGLMQDCTSSTKLVKQHNKDTRLKLDITISHAGVQFIDEKTIICVHDIENISCVCQDADDLRHFAYITKESDLYYCHVFMVDEVPLASEIILTLGQAFEVAYQMTLKSNVNPITEETNTLGRFSLNDI